MWYYIAFQKHIFTLLNFSFRIFVHFFLVIFFLNLINPMASHTKMNAKQQLSFKAYFSKWPKHMVTWPLQLMIVIKVVTGVYLINKKQKLTIQDLWTSCTIPFSRLVCFVDSKIKYTQFHLHEFQKALNQSKLLTLFGELFYQIS